MFKFFPLKPASFRELSAGPDSTNTSAIFLLLFDSRCPLLRLPFTSISSADLAGTVFSFHFYYQATMDPRILVSPGERRG